MRGITTFIVLIALLPIGLLIAVPVFDTLTPIATSMAPGYTSTITNIQAVNVKWVVPIYIASILVWAVFWILRQERQQVR